MPFLEPFAGDSPKFLARAESVVALALRARPASVYLVRIDHWFGSRWAGFGGKILGVAGVSYRSHLPIPPFVPARVVQQSCFRLAAESQEYVRAECEQTLHITQTSSLNLRRRVDEMLPGAAIVWFSGNSASASRGSVMAYVPSPEGHSAWYVDFNGARDWRAVEVIGLTPHDVAAA